MDGFLKTEQGCENRLKKGIAAFGCQMADHVMPQWSLRLHDRFIDIDR